MQPSWSDSRNAFASFLRESHVVAAHELPALISRHGAPLGLLDATLYLVDLQQQTLIPFLAAGEEAEGLEPIPVDTTLAGRAFQQTSLLPYGDETGQVHWWVPLLDGTERLGVLSVRVPSGRGRFLSAPQREELTLFASLISGMVMTKTSYGDTLVRLRRRVPMDLAAEIQWALLPPLTFVNTDVSVAAALEPAYQVAGDSVDYAVDARAAKLAVFDGMGHALASAQLVGLVVAAYRNARRFGLNLAQTVERVDQAVAAVSNGEGFVTGLLAELDLQTGTLTWASAGHPPPLLLRHGRLVKTLEVSPGLPFGLGATDAHGASPATTIGIEHLEPGDFVLLYTDGVTEARSPTGEMFGEDRLSDLVLKHLAAGRHPAETMRRTIAALLRHQGNDLADDATLLLACWKPADVDSMVP